MAGGERMIEIISIVAFSAIGFGIGYGISYLLDKIKDGG